MAFLLFRREDVETKQPEPPACSKESESSQQRVREKKAPDTEPRRAQAAHDDGLTIEEPGYGHGV
jgi:hypothetical protein